MSLRECALNTKTIPADLALDDVEVAAHGVSFPLCRYHHSKLPTHKYGKVGTYIYRTQPFSWTRR